jgi:aminoglycoside 6-adenylyltransferase
LVGARRGRRRLPDHVLRVLRRGLKADIQIRPTGALAGIAEGGLDDLYERGYAVLADPSGLAARLPAPSGRPPRLRPPTDAELRDGCLEFWYEAAHIPKLLARGELWVVKFRDGTMKRMLLWPGPHHAAERSLSGRRRRFGFWIAGGM